jgi:long-chain acyl-CoA synthetase
MFASLEKDAHDIPDKDALIFLDSKISYSELNSASNRFASALLDIGVKKGDRVALLMPNMPQFVMAAYGIWKIGAVAVPHNPLYTDPELKYQLNNSGCKVIVSLDLQADRIINLRKDTDLQHIIVAHIRDYLGFPKKQLLSLVARDKHKKISKSKNVYEWMDLQKQYSDNNIGRDIDIQSLCLLMYTGGTTGVSKGVMLTHKNFNNMAQIFTSWFTPLHKGDVVEIGSIPFFHVYGLGACMITCVEMGWTDVLIPRPEAEVIMEAIHKYKARFIPTVPTIFYGIMNHPKLHKYNLTSIDVCLSGAAPLPAEIMDKFESLTGTRITEFYGMTEMSAGATGNPVGEGAVTKVGSVGVPLPETDMKIVDLENGTSEVPSGEHGEIIFKGPQVTQGYYQMPEETAQAMKNGWLYTGDIGKMDEDGYLYVIDRKKDMIIASGYNIYPRDIDEVLFAHPKIAQACAIGIPDKYRGETVKAFIVLKPGQEMKAEEVIEYCKTKLAAYKVPKIVEFIDELPNSSAGKILRKELRAMELEKQKG